MDKIACIPASDMPAQRPPIDLDSASLDALLTQATRRSAAILDMLRPHVSLVESGDSPQVRIEPLGTAFEALSPAEIAFVKARMKRVNQAIRAGDIVVTPGLSSARIVNRGPALDALAPGFFGEASPSKVPSFLSVVSGQWFPPGITIELTPQETDQLIDSLILGAFATVVANLEAFGLASEIAFPLALALLAVAGAVKICKELSATGAVGFKIFTLLPPFVSVTPYPV